MNNNFMREQKCWIGSNICSYLSKLYSKIELNGGILNNDNNFKLLEYEIYQLF